MYECFNFANARLKAINKMGTGDYYIITIISAASEWTTESVHVVKAFHVTNIRI